MDYSRWQAIGCRAASCSSCCWTRDSTHTLLLLCSTAPNRTPVARTLHTRAWARTHVQTLAAQICVCGIRHTRLPEVPDPTTPSTSFTAAAPNHAAVTHTTPILRPTSHTIRCSSRCAYSRTAASGLPFSHWLLKSTILSVPCYFSSSTRSCPHNCTFRSIPS